MTRPKTAEEIAALRVGPEPPERMTVSFWADDDDGPLGYTDVEGQFWALGKYADGGWFRHRA